MAQNNSMAKSAMYNMIAKFGQMAIQLIIQMVLANLHTPLRGEQQAMSGWLRCEEKLWIAEKKFSRI